MEFMRAKPSRSSCRRAPARRRTETSRLKTALTSVAILLPIFEGATNLMCDAAPPADTNYDESRVPKYTLPELLVSVSGKPIENEQAWVRQRRPEIIRLFEESVYGQTPKRIPFPVDAQIIEQSESALDSKATRVQVEITFGAHQKASLLLYVPNNATQPVPCFLGLNFFGNQTVHSDPEIGINSGWMRANDRIGIVDHRATQQTRGAYADRWQIPQIIARGYAVGTMYCGDLDPDNYRHDFSDGVHPLFYRDSQEKPADYEWGAIGAWAWGLSRALDFLQQHDIGVNASRVAVIGHSRLGKTALWAGAQDERFALVISNNSGCGGAALYRRCFGEQIHHMIGPVGYWFCFDHRNYAKRESELPVDQHMLIALMAPRPVYVASADEDQWADPKGEFLAAKNASPVYELLGKPGLPADAMPEIDTPVHGTIGYHIRSGKHDVTAYDWQQYLNFADKHLK